MSEPEINAIIREDVGKANTGRIRRTGYVPCTIYGIEKESSSLAVNKKELERLLSNAQSVITIKVDGNEQKSVIKEIQYHPLKGDIIHVDFMRIKATDKITMQIPLHFIGEDLAPGVKIGGGIVSKRWTEGIPGTLFGWQCYTSGCSPHGSEHRPQS